MRSMIGVSLLCAFAGIVLFELDPSDSGIRFPSIVMSHRFYISCVQPVS
jgi:hypothetical protein